MTAHPILVVGLDGRIVRTNEAARRRFGLCVGRRCADVVSMCDGHRRQVCNQGCAAALIEQAGGQETRGRVGGQDARVFCEAVGDEVMVMLLAEGQVTRPHQALTPREAEVLGLVADGLTGREIASRLSLSRSTVRTHIEHVRDKLGCRTRAEAVATALAMGLIPDAR